MGTVDVNRNIADLVYYQKFEVNGILNLTHPCPLVFV